MVCPSELSELLRKGGAAESQGASKTDCMAKATSKAPRGQDETCASHVTWVFFIRSCLTNIPDLKTFKVNVEIFKHCSRSKFSKIAHEDNSPVLKHCVSAATSQEAARWGQETLTMNDHRHGPDSLTEGPHRGQENVAITVTKQENPQSVPSSKPPLTEAGRYLPLVRGTVFKGERTLTARDHGNWFSQ